MLPYLVHHERREAARTERRRILYAAVHLGLDLDQRDIHAAGVAS